MAGKLCFSKRKPQNWCLMKCTYLNVLFWSKEVLKIDRAFRRGHVAGITETFDHSTHSICWLFKESPPAEPFCDAGIRLLQQVTGTQPGLIEMKDQSGETSLVNRSYCTISRTIFQMVFQAGYLPFDRKELFLALLQNEIKIQIKNIDRNNVCYI